MLATLWFATAFEIYDIVQVNLDSIGSARFKCVWCHDINCCVFMRSEIEWCSIGDPGAILFFPVRAVYGVVDLQRRLRLCRLICHDADRARHPGAQAKIPD